VIEREKGEKPGVNVCGSKTCHALTFVQVLLLVGVVEN
jgi:hypothetical protein